MLFESISTSQTSITQTFSLSGPNANDFIGGMDILKKSAPEGLAKLAKAIELAKDNPSR